MLIIWGLLLLFIAPPIGIVLLLVGVWIEVSVHMEKAKQERFKSDRVPLSQWGMGLELYREGLTNFVKSIFAYNR